MNDWGEFENKLLSLVRTQREAFEALQSKTRAEFASAANLKDQAVKEFEEKLLKAEEMQSRLAISFFALRLKSKAIRGWLSIKRERDERIINFTKRCLERRQRKKMLCFKEWKYFALARKNYKLKRENKKLEGALAEMDNQRLVMSKENDVLREKMLGLEEKNRDTNSEITSMLMKSIYTLNEKVLLMNKGNLNVTKNLAKSSSPESKRELQQPIQCLEKRKDTVSDKVKTPEKTPTFVHNQVSPLRHFPRNIHAKHIEREEEEQIGPRGIKVIGDLPIRSKEIKSLYVNK